MARSQKVLVKVVYQMKNERLLSTIPEESGMKPVLRAHEARRVEDMRRDHSVFSIGVVLLVWVTFIIGRMKDRRAVDSNDQSP